MRRDLINSVLAILVFTVLLGLAYPLATTGFAQVLWPNKADGSQIERGGKVVGSRLIGQDFKGRPRYFQSRPSVTGYDPGLSKADVPPDAVQTAASGVDPHISTDNARIQAQRVAEVRGLHLDRVLALVGENTDDRGLGVFGEPGVNVLELNLALDDGGAR